MRPPRLAGCCSATALDWHDLADALLAEPQAAAPSRRRHRRHDLETIGRRH